MSSIQSFKRILNLSINSLDQNPTLPNPFATNFSFLIVLRSETFALSVFKATNVFLTIFKREDSGSVSVVIFDISNVDICRRIHNLCLAGQCSVIPNTEHHPSIRQFGKAVTFKGVCWRPLLLDADPFAARQPLNGTSSSYYLATIQCLRTIRVILGEVQPQFSLEGFTIFGFLSKTLFYILPGGMVSAVGKLAGFSIKIINKSKRERIAQVFHEAKGSLSIIVFVILKLDYFALHCFLFQNFIMLIMNTRISSNQTSALKKTDFLGILEDEETRMFLLCSKMTIMLEYQKVLRQNN